MATKLFGRNSRDVFDKITESDGPPDAGEDPTDETVTPTADVAEVLPEEDRTATESTAESVPDETAEAEDADLTDAGPQPDTDQPVRKRWVRHLGRGAVVLLAVAGLGLLGFFGWQLKQQRDIDNAGREALSSAQHFAVVLTSIDTNKVDENFNEVVSSSTGQFKDMYSQSASQLRQVLIDNKAMSKGTVIDSAVKSAAKDRVDVVLFVDQWITNTANPQPRMDRSRVAMTMELVDGRWLASNVELK